VRKRELSDEDLVLTCLQGDAGAWTTLVHRYGKLVYGIALRAGLPAEDSADVTQTVFLTTFRNLHLLERPASLRFWLSMIARREAWQAKRRSTNPLHGAVQTGEGKEDLEIAASEPLPDEELVRLENLFLVHRALDRLDERCRRLLEMLFFRNPPLSYEDTARELGAPAGSIGPTRARCFEKLRKILRELGF
jgi:RNA polymerase sigma factor (sigma-70 family)